MKTEIVFKSVEIELFYHQMHRDTVSRTHCAYTITVYMITLWHVTYSFDYNFRKFSFAAR